MKPGKNAAPAAHKPDTAVLKALDSSYKIDEKCYKTSTAVI
jgi:hypothetical protein